MKKLLLGMLATALTGTAIAQIKYVDPVYSRSTVTRTTNVMYADAYSVLTGSAKLDTLRMDVYTPTANMDAARPLVVYCHTGSFLPRYINQLATGARDDSATVEICTQLAQRGYVVAAISYRLGWNPRATTEDERKNQIINAAYRGVQDLSTAVRFFKKSAANMNPYGIDTTKIAVGGQGTGGYVTYAYATIDKQEEIKIDKFFDFNTNTAMVNDTLWGDRKGMAISAGSILARNNHAGHTSNSQVCFAFGGAMGDTSWMEAGEIPIISAHGIYDPFAPYKTGIVKVPGTTLNVVEVSGGYDVMNKHNKLNNNAVYKGKVSDWYTMRANQLNDGIDGLFPFDGLANGSGPWEWWDSTRIRLVLTASGRFTQAEITTINKNSSESNPQMSKTRALKYIDTLLGYFTPRMAVSLGLVASVGVDEKDLGSNVTIAPNPAQDQFIIHNNWENNKIVSAKIVDINGRVLQQLLIQNQHSVHKLTVPSGLYFVQLQFEKGTAVQKLMVK